MAAISASEAVLVLVRLVVKGTREKRLVVALLQLHGVRARHVSRLKEFLRLLKAALVIVANFGNDEGIRLIRYLVAANRDDSFARCGGLGVYWRKIPHPVKL